MTELKQMMEQLHTATVLQLLERVRSGEATAAELNVARQMLKDNGINGIPAEGTPLDDLNKSLPDLDADDGNVLQFGR